MYSPGGVWSPNRGPLVWTEVVRVYTYTVHMYSLGGVWSPERWPLVWTEVVCVHTVHMYSPGGVWSPGRWPLVWTEAGYQPWASGPQDFGLDSKEKEENHLVAAILPSFNFRERFSTILNVFSTQTRDIWSCFELDNYFSM